MEWAIHEAERRSTAVLADGRVLATYEWGVETGFPVLFCTGAGMSGSLGFGLEHLHDRDMRLVVPDRPGLGKSSPDPAKSLASWAADMEAWLDQQGISAFAAVGFSQGAPFALALELTGRLTALALVSGQDDLSHAQIRPLLNADVSRMLQKAQADPVQFEQYIAQNISVDWLWDFILNSSAEIDRAVYTHPVFAPAYRRALEEGFSQGAAGYARDLAIALQQWVVQPEDVRCPVDLWYGLQDTSAVHSPDFGATLSQRFPKAVRHEFDDAGSALLWTHASAILDRLLLASTNIEHWLP